MASAEKEYMLARQKRSRRIKKIFGLVALASFSSSMVFAAVPAIRQAVENDTSSQSQAASVESSIQKQIKGFELVLEREPENKTALEGLVRLRLALKDEKGAFAPLENLVKLEPQRGDYKVILEPLQKGEQSNHKQQPSPAK